jgi:hypothetical protein
MYLKSWSKAAKYNSLFERSILVILGKSGLLRAVFVSFFGREEENLNLLITVGG